MEKQIFTTKDISRLASYPENSQLMVLASSVPSLDLFKESLAELGESPAKDFRKVISHDSYAKNISGEWQCMNSVGANKKFLKNHMCVTLAALVFLITDKDVKREKCLIAMNKKTVPVNSNFFEVSEETGVMAFTKRSGAIYMPDTHTTDLNSFIFATKQEAEEFIRNYVQQKTILVTKDGVNVLHEGVKLFTIAKSYVDSSFVSKAASDDWKKQDHPLFYYEVNAKEYACQQTEAVFQFTTEDGNLIQEKTKLLVVRTPVKRDSCITIETVEKKDIDKSMKVFVQRKRAEKYLSEAKELLPKLINIENYNSDLEAVNENKISIEYRENGVTTHEVTLTKQDVKSMLKMLKKKKKEKKLLNPPF